MPWQNYEFDESCYATGCKNLAGESGCPTCERDLWCSAECQARDQAGHRRVCGEDACIIEVILQKMPSVRRRFEILAASTFADLKLAIMYGFSYSAMYPVQAHGFEVYRLDENQGPRLERIICPQSLPRGIRDPLRMVEVEHTLKEHIAFLDENGDRDTRYVYRNFTSSARTRGNMEVEVRPHFLRLMDIVPAHSRVPFPRYVAAAGQAPLDGSDTPRRFNTQQPTNNPPTWDSGSLDDLNKLQHWESFRAHFFRTYQP